jgi:hypothetical protein
MVRRYSTSFFRALGCFNFAGSRLSQWLFGP